MFDFSRWIRLGVLVGLLLVGALFAAVELGGETILLETNDERGIRHESELWIVDLGTHHWIRAMDRDESWVSRLERQPEVFVTREGERRSYRAKVALESLPEVDLAMSEKYGWAESVMSLVRPKGESLHIRLLPREEVTAFSVAYPQAP